MTKMVEFDQDDINKDYKVNQFNHGLYYIGLILCIDNLIWIILSLCPREETQTQNIFLAVPQKRIAPISAGRKLSNPFALNASSTKNHQPVMMLSTMSEKSIAMNTKLPNWSTTSVLLSFASPKLRMSKSNTISSSGKIKRLLLTASIPRKSWKTPVNNLTDWRLITPRPIKILKILRLRLTLREGTVKMSGRDEMNSEPNLPAKVNKKDKPWRNPSTKKSRLWSSRTEISLRGPRRKSTSSRVLSQWKKLLKVPLPTNWRTSKNKRTQKSIDSRS